MRSLGKSPELAEDIERGFEEELRELEELEDDGKSEGETKNGYDRAAVRAYRLSKQSGENMNPEMEARLIANIRNSKRFSQASIIDVADRHLKDKTDAIAHIIRNISEQCAAAVEGLQLAHDAEVEAEELAFNRARDREANRGSTLSALTGTSDDGKDYSAQGSDAGDDSLLQPNGRTSSIPPTPDLIHRSSTSMSISSSATTPERSSQQYNVGTDIPTKIVEDSDEELEGRSESELHTVEPVTKSGLLHRPAGARISAIGGH